MNNKKILLMSLLTAILLSACEAEPTRSADWYIQNTRDQATKHTFCQQQPDIRETANCIAAAKAELIISQGHEAIKKHLDSKGLKRNI